MAPFRISAHAVSYSVLMAPALIYTAYSYKSGVGEDNAALEEQLVSFHATRVSSHETFEGADMSLPTRLLFAQRIQYRKQQRDPRTLAAREATVARLKAMHSNDPKAQDELRDALAGGKESRRHGHHNRIPMITMGVDEEEEEVEEEEEEVVVVVGGTKEQGKDTGLEPKKR